MTRPLEATPLHVTDRRIYLINGLAATPAQLGAVLDRFAAGLLARPALGRAARRPLVTLRSLSGHPDPSGGDEPRPGTLGRGPGWRR